MLTTTICYDTINDYDFDTHYHRYCDQDDDQDRTINDFDTCYDQNCDEDYDQDHTIKHLNYEDDDDYNKLSHDSPNNV